MGFDMIILAYVFGGFLVVFGALGAIRGRLNLGYHANAQMMMPAKAAGLPARILGVVFALAGGVLLACAVLSHVG